MEEKKTTATINIELNEEVGEGTYSNLAIISHSHAEFVIDFVRVMPNLPKAKVKARIILPPAHAKRFLLALTENIKKYEAQYGPIKDVEPTGGYPLHFKMPKGQA